jgi:hypothetical protein
MNWKDQIKGDPIAWLLESKDTAVRHLALRDLLDKKKDDPELIRAHKAAASDPFIQTILEKMHTDGWWERDTGGYNPKYKSAVWSLIFLSQMGADIHMDDRIPVACKHYLDHSITENGQISTNGTPSYTIDCLQGNMLTALLDLGFEDPRLDKAFEWMARTTTGEGLASSSTKDSGLHYYAYKCGPDFACGANYKLTCAWGGVKVMLAFSRLPKKKRTPLIERAISRGAEVFFKIDPATAKYPQRLPNTPPSRNWWKFGFPVFYITDLLQLVEAFVGLGYGKHPRLADTLQLIRDKQDEKGRWSLDYHYTGKTYVDIPMPQIPNKWVTLRALRVLKLAG